MKKKTILITGAGSGFGHGAALGLAEKGYHVIAGVHVWPQVTQMRQQAEELGLKTLRIKKLDICDPLDVTNAVNWDIDILVNNAAIGYGGPISEIPLDLVRDTFETNVFAGLNLSQKFIRKFINEKRAAKIVFTSSIAGLSSVPGLGAYCASKHALECIAETLQKELEPYNIQVQTINPGAYATGFNESMAQAALHWVDNQDNFHKKAEIVKILKLNLEDQRDPQELIEAMIKIIPADSGKFRNVVPKKEEDTLKKKQTAAWKKNI